MSNLDDCVGVLAGRGAYPSILAECLTAHGHLTVIAGIEGQFFGTKTPVRGPTATFPLGALRATILFFRRYNARQIFFAGGVERQGAWRTARPDRHALSLVLQALTGGDDRLLRAVAQVFLDLGVEVKDPSPLLTHLFAGSGILAGPGIDEAARRDVEVAIQTAHKLGVRDAGQAAIAYCKKVVALEDRRGTDALLAKAPGPGAVLAKVVKPGQDLRFDMPAIGPSTALLAHAVRLRAIAVEAGGVLLLERERLLNICNKYGISLIGVKKEGQ